MSHYLNKYIASSLLDNLDIFSDVVDETIKRINTINPELFDRDNNNIPMTIIIWSLQNNGSVEDIISRIENYWHYNDELLAAYMIDNMLHEIDDANIDDFPLEDLVEFNQILETYNNSPNDEHEIDFPERDLLHYNEQMENYNRGNKKNDKTVFEIMSSINEKRLVHESNDPFDGVYVLHSSLFGFRELFRDDFVPSSYEHLCHIGVIRDSDDESSDEETDSIPGLSTLTPITPSDFDSFEPRFNQDSECSEDSEHSDEYKVNGIQNEAENNSDLNRVI